MSTFNFIKATENTINNSIKNLDRNSTNILNGFLTKTKLKSLTSFSISSSNNRKAASKKTKASKKKHNSNLKSIDYINEVNSIITDFKIAITATNVISIKTVTNLMDGFTSTLTSGIISNVNTLINSELSKLSKLIGIDEFNANITQINSVVSNANELANLIIAKQTDIKSISINSIITDLTSVLNKSISSLSALIPDIANIIEDTPVNIFKKVPNNFFKRSAGQSICSKYIQANVPSANGSIKTNSSILNETPDAKIITPKLKKDTNTVKLLVSLKDSLLNNVTAPITSFLDNVSSLGSSLTSIAKGISPIIVPDISLAKVGISIPEISKPIPNLNLPSLPSSIIPSILSDNPTFKG